MPSIRDVVCALCACLFVVSSAQAQPQLSVSATEVPGGGSVTVTVNATPGLYLGIIGSSRDGGVTYGGVSLNIGADLTVLFLGFVPASGVVSFPFAPPLANGLDVYYLLAVTSASPDFVPPSPSATIALRQRGFYSFAPTFPHGLSAGGARVTGVGLPVVPDDAATKAYVDASQFRLGPPATQAAATTTPLIDTEQTASGDLMSLRTNSSTYPGSGGLNPNRVQFRILPDGGFYARGQYGVGVIPVAGTGERLMWYPSRAAFRAGSVSGAQWDNAAVGLYTWAGGLDSVASGTYALAHGAGARAAGTAAVAFGRETLAAGQDTLVQGFRSAACGPFGVALGLRASTSNAPTDADPCGGTDYAGVFTYGDSNSTPNQYVFPTAANQFVTRFSGGYRLYTNAALTTGMAINAGGSSWVAVSDRNAKFGFAEVDEDDVLERLMRVPISTFYYKDGDGQRYIGPVAQDFHAAFGLGNDDKTIRTMDIDGVTMASIQALTKQVRQLQRDNERLSSENAELGRQLAEILSRLDREDRAKKQPR
jgi:trimeric autotransporter adhesin